MQRKIAIATGFVFYFVAGTLTTHRGGKSSRAAWAGFWAGIISTIMFWLSMGIGLFILVLQRTLALQRLGITPRPDIEFNHIWRIVMPMVYNHPIVLMRPGPGTCYLLVQWSFASHWLWLARRHTV